MTGGKPTEHNMPSYWFDSYIPKNFENIPVYIPKEYDKYLSHIYGDYQKRTLVEGKMLGDQVLLNAIAADTKLSYTNYTKN